MSTRPWSHRLEPALFWSAVLAHLWPVWANHWFVTLDGPCHVYNARLILDLLQGHGRVAEFLRFNPFPEPNWLGHAIMAAVMTVAPARLAEKVIFTLIIAGMGWSFRRLALRLQPERPWAAWLVMPFLLHFPLRLGFINFSLGLPLLLMALERWEVVLHRGRNKELVQVAIVVLALYFAHITCCVTALVAMAIRTASLRWSAPDERSQRNGWRLLAWVAVVPVALSAAFVGMHHTGEVGGTSLSLSERVHWILEGRIWNTLVHAEELPYALAIAVSLIGLGLWSLVRLRPAKGWTVVRSWSFALCALGMLTAFLVLPDKLASGGVLSPRLLIFAMLLLAVFVVSLGAWRPATYGLLGVLVLADLAHMPQQSRTAARLSNEATELLGVAPALHPNAVVLPLNYSDNWMHSNFSQYVGAVSGCIVLDNIGAASPHFPLMWRAERSPYDAIGSYSTSNRPCVRINAYRDAHGALVDHVITWKLSDAMTDSCTLDLRAQLLADFELAATSPHGDAVLYRRR